MKDKIVKLLSDKIEQLNEESISALLEQPPKKELGDYAFPCFRLAKELHKAPQMIANDLVEQIKSSDADISFLDKIEVQGAYVNFFVKKNEYAKTIIEASIDDNYGSSNVGNGKVICIDYYSPNVAKNFHV